MDFSGYRIYIADDGRIASLIEPNDVFNFFMKKFLTSFDEGIKILQKENRTIWLPPTISKRKEVSKYFRNTYGISTAY